ncbi:uncharacterized protein BO97DRAFT_418054 [Aspergillus homomorphus CBS 101889]|uniref:Uncharacterized protein n=1 Tax=Aspergillus homomorphus (strain CBS 101889) TaxID=1450537 RepID=A0A395HP68_ASPHC|nr:hypothetical protein BO97DRAFT_418054 [Aspergillus homomorphus CBS 101889]RAL08064.1 hypothetical protein BO97DRAFT_418054 [Aspergillus homomorphus CBS 101889]
MEELQAREKPSSAVSVKKEKITGRGSDPQDVEVGMVAALNHGETGLKRNFNMVSIMALGFNTSNSWMAIAGSLPLAIAGGGTVTLLYGVLVVCFAMSCAGLRLAELAAVIRPRVDNTIPLQCWLRHSTADGYLICVDCLGRFGTPFGTVLIDYGGDDR